MKQFADFLPIVIFFAAYYLTGRDLITATAILIVAQTLQLAIVWGVTRAISGQMKFQFWAVLVLGGLTLALGDGRFIQWKPTLVNWALACFVGGSNLVGERNVIERLLGSELKLPSLVWRTLAWGWSVAFFTAGALNLVVAYNFSEEFWVNYKLFGGFGLTALFMVVTVVYLARGGYLVEPEEEDTPAGEAAADTEGERAR